VKAFLLAAGIGSRLRPLTDTTPKCMIPIDGRPMLDIWLEALAGVGVREVLVNVHHLAEAVESHLANRVGAPRVRVAPEPVLLGSAGTLRANRDFVAGEDRFLVVYADNLTTFDLGRLIQVHDHEKAPAMAVFRAPCPTECGIVEVVDGVVTAFTEKPAEPKGDLANAGMYAFSPDVLDLIQDPDPQDIGFDLLPRLVGRIRIVDIDGAYFRDIGTHAALARASEEWKQKVRA
jgi:mannose-1-phosphate guanylyltransferase